MDTALTQKLDQLLGKFNLVLDRLDRKDPDLESSMTTDEAADFLKIHKTSLLRYAQGGTIPYHRIGKSFTFCRSDLIRFREGHRTTASGAFLGKLITQGK